MEDQGDTLQADTQHTDGQHVGVSLLVEDGDDGRAGEEDDFAHDQRTHYGHGAGEGQALLDPLHLLRTPVEADNGLVAHAEAQDDGEGELHDAVGDGQSRQGRCGDAAGHVVDDHGGHHGHGGAEEGGGADGQHVLDVLQDELDLLNGDRHAGPLTDVRIEQDTEADELGQGCRHRSACHAQAQALDAADAGAVLAAVDEQRVQEAVEHAADADAHHGEGGAALTAQAHIEDKAADHKRRGVQDVVGVLHGVDGAVLVRAQHVHQLADGQAADDHKDHAQAQAGEKRGGQHPVRVQVSFLAQQAGDVAARARADEGADEGDGALQGAVDAHGGGGIGTQGTDKVGVNDVVNGRDELRNDRRDRHFGYQGLDVFGQHHLLFLSFCVMCH